MHPSDEIRRRPRRAVSVPRELDPALIADDALRLFRLATSLLQTDAPFLTDYFHQGDQSDAVDTTKVDHHTALMANQLNQFGARETRQHSLNLNQQQLPAICCGTSTPERRKSSSSSTSSLGSSVTACAMANDGITGIFSRAGSSQKSSISSSDESNSISKEGECSLVRASVSIPSGNNQFRRNGEVAIKMVRGDTHIEVSSSSTENESGFSSMNSFHEIGLPLINSTMISSKSSSTTSDDSRTMIQNDDSTLKRKSANTDKSIHQLWDSVPVSTVLYNKTKERVTLKSDDIRVLWV